MSGGSHEHSSLIFIARLVVLTKVLKLCRSKTLFIEAYHDESKEIQQAFVAQLARLMAEILGLNLASCHLLITRRKAKMA